MVQVLMLVAVRTPAVVMVGGVLERFGISRHHLTCEALDGRSPGRGRFLHGCEGRGEWGCCCRGGSWEP
ncbi:MAG: hypothetical protein KatS3mg132_873 [Limisphaera sp.]|nr:MAG: hypothetical protein KatS3mg132_873 [Limisphaera sp.]